MGSSWASADHFLHEICEVSRSLGLWHRLSIFNDNFCKCYPSSRRLGLAECLWILCDNEPPPFSRVQRWHLIDLDQDGRSLVDKWLLQLDLSRSIDIEKNIYLSCSKIICISSAVTDSTCSFVILIDLQMQSTVINSESSVSTEKYTLGAFQKVK